MKHQIPKGLFDIVPYGVDEEWRLSANWQYLEKVLRKLAVDYGFSEIRTPIFERTELFSRVGQTSDIVSKEMYTFEDRAKRSMSLRPEGTSAVMRAFIEKSLFQEGKIHKLFYIGPMFRYERPQSGRYRQHHQFGVEAIGNDTPEQDAEIIDMIWQLYKRLGISQLTLMLSSIGSIKTRNNFKSALQKHLKPHLSSLSEDSQERFEKNPLRILDSKHAKDQPFLKDAPSILEYLSDEESAHFEKLCSLLKKMKIPFEINPRIVRGLDYYNGTVFEVVATDFGGAQNALGAGGRFDGLIHSLGGPELPAIGFAVGIERILQTMLQQKVAIPEQNYPFIFFVPLDDQSKDYCFSLVTKLRHAKIPAEVDLSAKKLQQSMQRADRLGAKYAAVIGSNELESNKISLKHMETRKTVDTSLDELYSLIHSKWEEMHG